MIGEITARFIIRERGRTEWMTDVFITENGVTYYSRLNYGLADTPHARAAQIEAFKVRRRRTVAADMQAVRR